MYRYGLTNRPPMYGTVPDGWENPQAHPDFPLYGTIDYPAPVSIRDMFRFELVLISPLPDMPVYAPGTIVQNRYTGKVYEVELVYGEYWIGDAIMPTEHTWRSVAHWHRYEPMEGV